MRPVLQRSPGIAACWETRYNSRDSSGVAKKMKATGLIGHGGCRQGEHTTGNWGMVWGTDLLVLFLTVTDFREESRWPPGLWFPSWSLGTRTESRLPKTRDGQSFFFAMTTTSRGERSGAPGVIAEDYCGTSRATLGKSAKEDVFPV